MTRTRPHLPPPAPAPPGRPGTRPTPTGPGSRFPRRTRLRPGAVRERGSAAVEITLLTPLLLIMLLFVVFLGRVTEAQAVISDAAHQAARAASIALSPAAATAQARQAADTALSGRGLACQHFTVSVGLAGFRPGGTVRATVTCTTGLSDLALLAVPGSHTLSASFTSVIDTYRSATAALGFSHLEGLTAAGSGDGGRG
ncbi:MAG: TadE/TadG family type IV pilus assembly protein [Streptosporangiaceae bacterium]